jgi:hypothetical protein
MAMHRRHGGRLFALRQNAIPVPPPSIPRRTSETRPFRQL